MNSLLIVPLAFALTNLGHSAETDLNEVVFVILSQSNPVHAEQADRQRQELTTQLKNEGVKVPKIFDLHNDWTMDGECLVKALGNRFGDSTKLDRFILG